MKSNDVIILDEVDNGRVKAIETISSASIPSTINVYLLCVRCPTMTNHYDELDWS